MQIVTKRSFGPPIQIFPMVNLDLKLSAFDSEILKVSRSPFFGLSNVNYLPPDASKYQQAFEEARKLSSLNMSLELGKLNLDDSSCSEEEDEAETTAEEQEKVTNDSKVSTGASERNTSERNTSEKNTSEKNTSETKASETKDASEPEEGKDVNGSVKEEKEEAKDD